MSKNKGVKNNKKVAADKSVTKSKISPYKSEGGSVQTPVSDPFNTRTDPKAGKKS